LDEALARFIERIADETPAPGGGSTAAVIVAMAAALVEMAARFSHTWEGAPDAVARAHALREKALPLAQRDAEAYEAVLRTAKASGPAARAAALANAAAVPLEIAELGADVAELGVVVAAHGNHHLRGDAAAGSLFGAAATRVAANLVAINLERQAGDERVARGAALAAQAAASAERALATTQ
jgi:methenyltetrahydrofolate cyclohydrolase